MTRTLLVVAVLLSLGVLAVLLGRGGGARTAPPPPAAVRAYDGAAATVLETARTLAAADTAGARSTAVVEEPIARVAAPADAAALPHCSVVGRIVDEHGTPIADARAVLYAFREWRAESGAVRPVRVPHSSPAYTLVGFEATTGEDGRFRIEAPLPTAQQPSLALDGGPLRHSASIRFGHGNTGPLVEGERDIGDVVLAAAGAVRGRVVDARGSALAGVELDLGAHIWSTLQRNTWSDGDGRFLLGHAPIGEQHLKAKHPGFLSLVPMPVSIRAGDVTDVGDVVLESAPTIEGRVRDEAGHPLAGVRISGWPESGGSYVSATSGADGRFVVHLPQVARHTLAAKLDGYAPWGDEHDREKLVEPGTRDIEIVLASMASTRFVVVDAATGVPIERFGFELLENRGSKAPMTISGETRRPPLRDRPGGVAEATAREGIDAFVVGADGYLLASGDVRHDVPGIAVQTVRLASGRSLRGRVVDGGEPVAGAGAALEGWSGVIEVRVDGVVIDGVPARLFGAALPPTTTDADGVFVFAGVPAGRHRLTVRPPRGAPVVRTVDVPQDRDVDLGDVALVPGGVIVGELLAPAGVAPSGVTIVLGDPKDRVRTTTDASGRFRFENVPAGTHGLVSSALAGRLDGGARAEVDVAPGETASVTLDARDLGLCEVELVLLLNGAPFADADVFLRGARPGVSTPVLGRTDADGRVRGHARGGAVATVSVMRDEISAVHPTARLELPTLGRFEATVRFELGELLVELPASSALPEKWRATLVLDAGQGSTSTRKSTTVADERTLRFAGVPVGSFAITVEIFDATHEPVRSQRPDGSVHVRWEPVWSGRGEAVVELGRTTRTRVE